VREGGNPGSFIKFLDKAPEIFGITRWAREADHRAGGWQTLSVSRLRGNDDVWVDLWWNGDTESNKIVKVLPLLCPLSSDK
jgi:hypothetical protein